MTFNENAELDTSQVESGGRSSRGLPGGLQVGGGIGGLIVLILMVVFGGDLIGGSTGSTSMRSPRVRKPSSTSVTRRSTRPGPEE